MNISNRLFTYPVLSEDKEDYTNSYFNVNYRYDMIGLNRLQLKFDIELNNQELEELILIGKAEYVIHLECSSTAFREVIHSISPQIEYAIPVSRLNKKLEIVAFIILKNDIDNISFESWADDYEGISFKLSAGSILAYQNLSALDLTKEYEEFTSAESIFSIFKKLTDEERPAEIILDSSKIKIGLGIKEYEIYAKYSGKPQLQTIFNSMIIFPTLIFIFEELRNGKNIEMYQDKEWFIALESSYMKRGLNFRDEIMYTDKTSFQLAQEVMEMPLSKALFEMASLLNMTDED